MIKKKIINRAKKIRSTEASKVLAYQLKIINDAEMLLDGFNHSLQIKQDSEKIRTTKDKLKKQLLDTKKDNQDLLELHMILETMLDKQQNELMKDLKLGLAYDIVTSEINKNSFEVMLGYNFNIKVDTQVKRYKNPRFL